MYRRRFGNSSLGTPSTFHNRYSADRTRRYRAPSSGHSYCRYYGPRRRYRSRHYRDRGYWSWFLVDFAADDEKKDKEKEDKEEKERVPDEEVEKLSVLTVKNVNLHIRENAKAHHTNSYDCTRAANGEDAQAVLRRGQEFDITITFNRAYEKDKDDLIFIVDADEDTPGKKLKERFKLDEDGTGTYRKDDEWGARILEMDEKTNTVKMAVYIPADSVVGEWELKVKTKLEGEKDRFVYTYPQPMIILFNPWSEEDQVYMADTELLKEYILNDSGSVYTGCSSSIGSRPWSYGQFDKGILAICLSILRKAFGFSMSANMADPIRVSRALSRIVNDCGDKGVLVGNWSGNYEGGKRPTEWKTSTAILRQYENTCKPVKYGQCWVFSHVMTAVCRALGLPCRSVTNFSSAHDADNTCTIDCYYDEEGEERTDMKCDSIWNFHVWNEVWILRPDLKKMKTGDLDGWHVIDATPQEKSDGVYQCGPCPVKAVKEGLVNIGYDTGFVFGEVNADKVSWIVDEDGEVVKANSKKKKCVGRNISTKVPDGKPHGKSLNWHNQRDPNLRYDLTDQYKYAEGTEEEREAVERAVRSKRFGSKLYEETAELDLWFDTEKQTVVGKDLVLTAYVMNCSSEEKEVKVLVSARTSTYWDNSDRDKPLAKEKFSPTTFKAGEQKSFELTVTAQEYLAKCDESLCIYAYIRARDMKCNMPYSEQEPFRLRRPDLDMEGPEKAMSGETVTITGCFTNPLDKPLTQCNLTMEGGLSVAPDDPNNFSEFFWTHTMTYRDVMPEETVTLTFRLCGQVDDDEDEPVFRHQDFSFNCQELEPVTGCKAVEVRPRSCGESGNH